MPRFIRELGEDESGTQRRRGNQSGRIPRGQQGPGCKPRAAKGERTGAETAADKRKRREAQGRVAEAGWKRGRRTTRWESLCNFILDKEQVKIGRASKRNGYGWGGGRKEGEITIQKTGEKKGGAEVLSFTQYTQSVALGNCSPIVSNRFTRLSFNIVRCSNSRLPSALGPTVVDSYMVCLA